MFAFDVAKRFLSRSKSQTILISLGIAVGVAVQIFVGLLIGGLQDSLIDRTIGSSPHISISLPDDATGIDSVLESDGDITGYTPKITNRALIGDYQVINSGYDIKGADKIYGFSEKLVKGNLPENQNEVIIGILVAENLKLDINDKITIITSGAEKEYMVSGVADMGVKALNETLLARWLEADEAPTLYEVQISDVFSSEEKKTELEGKLGTGYTITDWQEENEELLSGLMGQSISSYMIQLFVLIAVLLGISSTLAITVIQKQKQIGILKAMGLKDSDARKVFLFMGLILGILGALLGALLGVGLVYAFATFAILPDGEPVVPVTLDFGFIALSLMAAVLASAAASLIPSRKSAKLTPVEVIRNG